MSPIAKPAHRTMGHFFSPQVAVSCLVIGIGMLLAAGALSIPSDAGYSGVGPNFLPWLVSGLLIVCGTLLLKQALTTGFDNMETPSGGPTGDWVGFAWISAGLLLNAALISTVGFIFSCTLCFWFAVQAFRFSEGRPDFSIVTGLKDVCIGLLIAAPVYWMFTQLLAIHLPGLTESGWL